MSIIIKSVTKFYGQQKALDNVSFEVRTGEVVGFLGPNGAGKTTMMKIITGFISASSGLVKVNGIDTETGSPEIKKKIGYLPENNPLYPEMYVREYLAFVAALYGSGSLVKRQVNNVIEITGLVPEQKKKIGSLSKGYRQRVGLAQALIHNPEVLILDEPTSGLDPRQIVEIRNLIKEAGKKKTVMLSTHIMQEVEAICDRVIIIDKGIIVADEKINNIYSKIKQNKQVIRVEFDKDPGEKNLEKIPYIKSAVRIKENTWLMESEEEKDVRPEIFSFAVKNNLTVLSLLKEQNNLEEIFRLLTNS